MNSRTAFRVLITSALALPLTGMAPQRSPQAAAAATPEPCEPRIAINQANTPGDADSQFRISRSGSYYLPRNTIGLPGKSGIEIASSDVSIDLMGFSLSGVPGSLDGIVVEGLQSNVRVSDGVIARFGEDGADLSGATAALVDRLHVSGNGATGVRAGNGSTVQFITTTANGYSGASIGNRSSVRHIIARDNANVGIHLGTDGLVSHCVSHGNDTGIVVGQGTEVASSVASVNEQHGFRLLPRSTVRACAASHNGSNGFSSTFSEVEVIDCKAVDNGEFGFDLGRRSLVRGNFAARNGDVGVGGGFRVLNSHSLLENNTSVQNTFMGYVIPDAENILWGNMASNNALNWSVVAGNACRVIKAAGGSGIYGDAGGTPLGPDDSTANYTF